MACLYRQRVTGGLAKTHSQPGTNRWSVNTTFQPLYPGKDPVAIVHEAAWTWAGPDGTENLTSTGPSSLWRVPIPTVLATMPSVIRGNWKEILHEYSEVHVIHNYCALYSHIASVSVHATLIVWDIRRLSKPVYLLVHVSKSRGWQVSVSWNLFLLLSPAPNYLRLRVC